MTIEENLAKKEFLDFEVKSKRIKCKICGQTTSVSGYFDQRDESFSFSQNKKCKRCNVKLDK